MSTTTRSRPPRRTEKKDLAAPLLAVPWADWQNILAAREPRSWQALLPKAKHDPLAWGWSSLAPVTPQWHRAHDALAAALALPQQAAALSEALWCEQLEELIRLASDAAALEPADDPLAHQMLAVELPLTLAYLFPELPACTGLAAQARKLWSWGAEEATDGEGMLAGRHMPCLAALAASWTRSLHLARQAGAVDEDVQVQYEWLLRQLLRWTRGDEGPCFTPLAPLAPRDLGREFFKYALKLTDDPHDHKLAKVALADEDKAKKEKKHKHLPPPHVHSEWGAATLLRGSWSPAAPRFALAFDEPRVRCELFARGELLLAGDWQAEVTIDGWKWPAEHGWEEGCWHADDDVLYLELETELTEGWTLQRQVLLGIEDKFLFLSDAILGSTPANLSYRGTLPLAANQRFLPADETREGYLGGQRAHALVLPLALPEWRSETGRGELKLVDDRLELTQAQVGRRLFAPLFIDLDHQRMRKDRTWRQLTVGEQLAIQPRDVAVAYRVQVAKQQWAFYRSLAPKANRTFLGQNVVHEFFAGRFKTEGNADTLIEIE